MYFNASRKEGLPTNCFGRTAALSTLLVLAGFLGLTGMIFGKEPARPGSKGQSVGPTKVDDIQVRPPPFSEGIFPCSACHSELPANRTRRKLVDMHANIVLKHGPKTMWCFNCHDAKNMDVLHLANGKLIPYTKSYLLCGQCHGDKLRDWKAGVHGKRTGYWNGRKTYLLCPSCHNPHSPHFKPIKPMPAPVPPSDITIANESKP